MNKTKVSIIGGSGYLAAELLRNLLSREDVEILRVSSKDHIGKNIGEVNRAFGALATLSLKIYHHVSVPQARTLYSLPCHM